MLYMNGFVSKSSTNQWKVFFKFRIFGQKQNFFQKNIEAWILINLQFVIYQWIRLNELYKLMESFFKFRFQIIGWKQKNIQTAWILMEVQWIIYQWIWLDKLYELMESFFQISESFFKLV